MQTGKTLSVARCGFPSIPLEDAVRGHSPEVLSTTHKAATTGRNSNRQPDNNPTVRGPIAACEKCSRINPPFLANRPARRLPELTRNPVKCDGL
jgi:hypothetical protein